MKFLLFEWMVGGGLLESDLPLDFKDSFFEQGSAMFVAMAKDLLASGHHVITPIDSRSRQSPQMRDWANVSQQFRPVLIDSNLRQTLQTLAAIADQIILIAPESEGILAQCYSWLEVFKEKWFGGPLSWIELASDKNSTQSYLQDHGVAVAATNILPGDQWVAKPALGAGGEGVQIFSDQTRLKEFQKLSDWRTESYVAGKSVSVSIIRSGEKTYFLPPTGQKFASGKAMHYMGTEFPINDDLSQRAIQLAEQTVAVLPNFSGYIGIDMVLAEKGPDVVIEINPRVTMSYCNLPLELRRRWLL